MHFFHPKLLDSLKSYNGTLFSKDILAGITVGVVALPLAMAFAIASGYWSACLSIAFTQICSKALLGQSVNLIS
jgi:MFS superfamily sulfate permease-like transporter